MHGFDPRFLLEGKVRRFPEFLRTGMKLLGGKAKLGPELVANPGPFSATTSWVASTATLAAASNELRVTGTSSGAGRADQQITCIPNVFYELTLVTGISSAVSGRQFRIGTAAGGTQILSLTGLVNSTTYVRRFRATQAAIHLSCVDGDSTGSNYVAFTKVSVKRVQP